MTIELKNIGMIKEAIVKIDGLTVIAGENDTGKSTVGKVIFSLIKASSRYKEDLEENKEKQIFAKIEQIYFKLRREIDFSNRLDLREQFFPPIFKMDVDRQGSIAIEKRLDFIYTSNNISENFNIFNKIENDLNQLLKIINTEDKIEDMQKRAFQKVLISEFKGKITNLNSTNKSKIKIFDGQNPILNVTIRDNKITKFEVYDRLYFNDATFIESPISLQLSELIDNSKTYFENIEKPLNRQPNISLHIKDLNEKLKESSYNEDLLDLDIIFSDLDINTLNNNLSNTMNGNIKYHKKTKDFIYISNGNSFYSINTATGIKSFGIIQMLLKSGYINKNSLLILDEPEVHLHPKWQLKYAKFIVKLVENNINVLVTSHSPYMIEALKRYSELENIEQKTNFYLAKDGYIEHQDSLENIFEKLALPMRELKKLKMAKYLND